MKIKEVLTYILTVLCNVLLAFLFTVIIFGNDYTKFIMVICAIILLSLSINYIVAKKLNYKLDIFAYNISDIKHLILNSIFIGNLFSIPIAMIISVFL